MLPVYMACYLQNFIKINFRHFGVNSMQVI